MSRINTEKKVISQMISLYCMKKHNGEELCSECQALKAYALKRLENCRYGESKPFCNRCSTPCYAKEQKERIKKVMRFSGPRMLFYHPITTVKHLFK